MGDLPRTAKGRRAVRRQEERAQRNDGPNSMHIPPHIKALDEQLREQKAQR